MGPLWNSVNSTAVHFYNITVCIWILLSQLLNYFPKHKQFILNTSDISFSLTNMWLLGHNNRKLGDTTLDVSWFSTEHYTTFFINISFCNICVTYIVCHYYTISILALLWIHKIKIRIES